jgi:hypothetical protein
MSLIRIRPNTQSAYQDLHFARSYFDSLAESLGHKFSSAWYSLQRKDIRDQSIGDIIDTYFNGLVNKALEIIYPDTYWLLWKFDCIAKGFWQDEDNQRNFFEWFALEKNILHVDDWYSINLNDFEENGGRYLILTRFNGSPSLALEIIYPNIEWQHWRFGTLPATHWNSMKNRRKFFDWLAEEFQIKTKEDWLGIDIKKYKQNGAWGLLNACYDGSPSKALSSIYSDTTWEIWRFQYVPRGYWDSLEHQREFFDWIFEKMDAISWEDWYSISNEVVHSFGGEPLLHDYYGGSLINALAKIYPEFQWQAWKFQNVSRGYWNSLESKRQYFDWIAEKMGLKNCEDWYSVDIKELGYPGNKGPMEFQHHPSNILMQVYPEVEWQPWRFDSIPKNYWNQLEHQTKYMEWLGDYLGIDTSSQWIGISGNQLSIHGAKKILSKYQGSLSNLLRTLYPSCEWNIPKWSLQNNSRSQSQISNFVKKLFRDRSEIEMESGMTWLTFDGTNSRMIFDIWLPSYNMAIEYQGIQHFLESRFMHNEIGMMEQQRRDSQKIGKCRDLWIDLVKIPFWVDLGLESLVRPLMLSR